MTAYQAPTIYIYCQRCGQAVLTTLADLPHHETIHAFPLKALTAARQYLINLYPTVK